MAAGIVIRPIEPYELDHAVAIEGSVPGTDIPVWGLIRDPRADRLAELGLGPRRVGR
jgi:hypothetical protein